VILWGFTGREESSQSYIFAQEDNFYYLTGHQEEGAGLIILPAAKAGEHSVWDGPREMLFLPAKEPQKEKWNGVRMAPTDADIAARTGFATVQPFGEMRAAIEKLAKAYPGNFYTILPYEKENGGYPHEKAVVDWLQMAVPQVKLKDTRGTIEALRTIKSPGEIAFLRKAIDLSVDSHLAAMETTRPGLWEYQVAAKMVEVHGMGGSEAEGYAPVVGAGFNSTVLLPGQIIKIVFLRENVRLRRLFPPRESPQNHRPVHLCRNFRPPRRVHSVGLPLPPLLRKIAERENCTTGRHRCYSAGIPPALDAWSHSKLHETN
jgi:hypothetical protein